MSSKGWLSIGSTSNLVPDTQFWEGEDQLSKWGFKMSRTTRLYGFIGCTVIGLALSILGVIFLFFDGFISFAIMYALGTIVSLLGTAFVLRFDRQFSMMFEKVRILATIVLLISIAMIFVGAFVIKSGIVCLILVFVQFLAYIWYNLSYIPYARSAVLGFLRLS